MTGAIVTFLDMLAASRTAWRRARNLRAARQAERARPQYRYGPGWAAVAALAAVLAGAFALVHHARALSGAVRAGTATAALAEAVPGAVLHVPAAPAISTVQAGEAAVLILSGARAGPAVRVDLCSQMPDPARPRLAPLRVGWRFADVAGLVRRNEAAGRPALLRNVVLAPGGAPMPRMEIGGTASAGFDIPLAVRWEGAARWVGDAGPGGEREAMLGKQGWLVWGANDALRIVRRAAPSCPQAGELVLQAYHAAGDSPTGAAVHAFTAGGAVVSTWLPPGVHQVPAAQARPLEDQALFEALLAHGLVRLNEAGLAELAPPDLMQWHAAGAGARLPLPPAWRDVRVSEQARQLLDRLYRRADGSYVREQVRIFNSERRLLAWRLQAGERQVGTRLAIDGAVVPVAEGAPAAIARLFARLPEGWGPWQSAASWPGRGRSAEIVLEVPPAPVAPRPLHLLVAGKVEAVAGAELAGRESTCGGRGCPAPDAVQRLTLLPHAGAREIGLRVQPLDSAALAAKDARYRHLVADNGRLRWQPLEGKAPPAAPALAPVSVVDREGRVLWAEGAPSAAALEAGLAALVGLRPEHAGSVAGMLARLPSPAGVPHRARLSIDIPLQRLADAVLDCVALRRGQWDGSACVGGTAPPAGRQAGLVILDTDTGDLLAAAGRPAAPQRASWSEVRDFDRANPAASVLRVPALQHDGGIHRSPGSTFKVVTALGLERAAQRDRRIGALLEGVPLAEIDRSAREAGFAFQTGAASYPANARAHITNFREQLVSPRAQDGRLGLGQALAYSINTWFAWTAEMSDATLFGQPAGGVPGVQALDGETLAALRPVAEMARRVGFERPLRLDGGLLPDDYRWSAWDVLQPPPARIDPIHTRHEVRQMAIGLRMQATPLQMALAAGAVGQGRVIEPRLLLELDGRTARPPQDEPLGVRLDRIRAGMKGVVDHGTAASAFRGQEFDRIRAGLYGKTGTAPTGLVGENGRELATVWFMGWLEPGALPGERRRLAFAVFASHSDATGGEHAAPVIGALLRTLQKNSSTKH